MTGCMGGGKTGRSNYTARGRVTDLEGKGVSGVTLLISGQVNHVVTSDENGNWIATDLSGSTIVIPKKVGWTFDPPSRSFSSAKTEQNFTAVDENEEYDGQEARISGTFTHGMGPASLGGSWESHELWVVPIIKGNDAYIRPGTVANRATKFPVSPEGYFRVDIAEVPVHLSDDFVLLLMDPTKEARKDQVIAFVSVTLDENRNAIMLPLDRLQGALDLGILVIEHDVASSSRTLADNAHAFSGIDVEDLLAMANFTNFGKLVVNDYINYYDSSINYSSSVILGYSAPREDVLNQSVDVGDFVPINVTVYFYTGYRNELYRFISPSGIRQERGGNIGPQSAAKWTLSISSAHDIESGWYQVINDNTNQVLAEFDLALSIIKDSYGEPVVPKPLIVMDTNDQDEIIGMWFNWVVEQDGHVSPLDPSIADRLIDRKTFYIDYPDSTFMFDRSSGGQPSMSGDFDYVTFDRPWTWESGRVGIGFRFGAYRVSHIFRDLSR